MKEEEEIIEMNGRISMPVETYHKHLKEAKKDGRKEERKEMALRIADLVVKKEIDKLIGEEVKKIMEGRD